MNDLVPLNPKVTMTPLGLEIHEDLTLDEWSEIGLRITAPIVERIIAFISATMAVKQV